MTAITLFQVLDQLSAGNHRVYEALTEQERKQFSPLILLKWMYHSGSSIEHLQEINFNFFKYDNWQQLVLLATVAHPRSIRWKWVKNTAAGESKTSNILISAIVDHYGVSRSTAASSLELFSPDEKRTLIDTYTLENDDHQEKLTSNGRKKSKTSSTNPTV